MALVDVACYVTEEISLINLNFLVKLECIIKKYGKFLETLGLAGLKIHFDIMPFHFKFFKGCLPQI